MESTGVYWIPLFQMLEAWGLKACLVNARHGKNVPASKQLPFGNDRKKGKGRSQTVILPVVPTSTLPPVAAAARYLMPRTRRLVEASQY